MTGELTFTLEIGALLRGTCIRALKSYCFNHHLGIVVDEDKGFLESLYRITITGDGDRITQAATDLHAWFATLEG